MTKSYIASTPRKITQTVSKWWWQCLRRGRPGNGKPRPVSTPLASNTLMPTLELVSIKNLFGLWRNHVPSPHSNFWQIFGWWLRSSLPSLPCAVNSTAHQLIISYKSGAGRSFHVVNQPGRWKKQQETDDWWFFWDFSFNFWDNWYPPVRPEACNSHDSRKPSGYQLSWK